MRKNKRAHTYLWHQESDCVFKVYSEKELQEVFKDPDGALCTILTFKKYIELKKIADYDKRKR